MRSTAGTVGTMRQDGPPCACCSPPPSWRPSPPPASSARPRPGSSSALRTEGVDVEVALPDYQRDRSPLGGEERRPLDVPSWAAPAVVRSGEHPVAGRLHLISAPRIARSHPYLRPDGAPWPDNAARFLAFSQAVAALVRRLQPDVVHLNGWHAGAALAALTDPPPTVLSLGDIAHQGVTDGSWLSRLGARGQHYEWWGGTNPLSGAIALADAVVAASPTHAGEIQTPARGYGLDEPLRHRWAALSGIRAGIDTASWDPETDAHLVATYRSGDGGGVEAAKAANRRALLARCGWPDDETPLAVMLSPLTTRKGADLIAPIVPVLGHVPLRLLVHAAGDQRIARTLAGLAADHRDTLRLRRGSRGAAAAPRARRRRSAHRAQPRRAVRDRPAGGDALRDDPRRHRRGRVARHRAGRRLDGRGERVRRRPRRQHRPRVGAVPRRAAARRPPPQTRPRPADHGARLVVALPGRRARRGLRAGRRPALAVTTSFGCNGRRTEGPRDRPGRRRGQAPATAHQ